MSDQKKPSINSIYVFKNHISYRHGRSQKNINRKLIESPKLSGVFANDLQQAFACWFLHWKMFYEWNINTFLAAYWIQNIITYYFNISQKVKSNNNGNRTIWLNGWVYVHELSGCEFDPCCCHLYFTYCACYEQGFPWHSRNYRVQIHSESHTWHDNNIQSRWKYYYCFIT